MRHIGSHRVYRPHFLSCLTMFAAAVLLATGVIAFSHARGLNKTSLAATQLIYQGSTLHTNQYLHANDYIASPSRNVILVLQTDGNLVEYNSSGQPLWASNTEGHPGDVAVMQSDGNLVIYSSNSYPLWASGTGGHAAAPYYLAIQNDTNVVVYGPTGALWSRIGGIVHVTSLIYQGSTLHTNQYLHANDYIASPSRNVILVLQTDGNLVEYNSSGQPLWASNTEGHPGDVAVMQSDGNLVIYSSNSYPLWASGTGGHAAAPYYLAIQNDTNVVVYGPTGALWSRMGGIVGGSTNYNAYPWANAPVVNLSLYDWGYTTCPASDPNCFGFGQVYDGHGLSDPWGYDLRNCTSYVAWFEVDQRHISANLIEGLGNARSWLSRAAQRGEGIRAIQGTMNGVEVGDVAWWPSSPGDPYGHVAIVTSVNANGTVNIAEYNQNYNGMFSTQTNQSPGGYIVF